MKRIAIFSVILVTLGIFLAFFLHGRFKKTVILYDPAPANVWNRLYAALFIRTSRDGRAYGPESLDPLYWSSTKHLIEGPSQAEAVRILDEFLDRHGENLGDPVRRAILQRDLWSLFDWTATRNRYEQVPRDETAIRALTTRLAEVIRRLALTGEQIESLPDNYADAVNSKAYPVSFDPEQPDRSFLPPDLFTTDAFWVCVEHQRDPMPAPDHTLEFGGRSVFSIFIHLPRGRTETLAYLEKLNRFPEPWIFDKSRVTDIRKAEPAGRLSTSLVKQSAFTNPDMPQFPADTEVAIVRQALLIDREGNLIPTHLTESVQIRVYRGIDLLQTNRDAQAFFEFQLSRANLFAGKAGGLRAIERGERDFSPLFHSMGIDPFENKNVGPGEHTLLSCAQCHSGAGINSVLSHSQFGSALEPPEYQVSSPERLGKFTADWKRSQFTWGFLNGLWQQRN